MDRFAICQAFAQLESDFNKSGWLHERPSNQRRRESIGCQLLRIGYSSPYTWVDIEAERGECDDPMDDEVRAVYLKHALLWSLPLDESLRAAVRRTFVEAYYTSFPAFSADGLDHPERRARFTN